MGPEQILNNTRHLIKDEAAGDADRWFYMNRHVFARLALDERKTKTAIKRRLLESNVPCHACRKPFETRIDVHLHRLDRARGYSDDNCVLMHALCHRDYEKHRTEEDLPGGKRSKTPEATPILRRESKAYAQKSFSYWWDIPPALADRLRAYEVIQFVKKDTKEYCTLPVEAISGFLKPERKTSRGAGNWGVRVLKGHDGELAFEPGTKQDKWLFLAVVWTSDEED